MTDDYELIDVRGKEYFCEDGAETGDDCNWPAVWEIRTLYHDECGSIGYEYFCDQHLPQKAREGSPRCRTTNAPTR